LDSHFCPGFAKGDDAIENKLLRGRILGIDAEIAKPFELASASWSCTCQAGLHTTWGYGDIVLPAATYAERDGVATTGGNVSYIGITNQAIEPVGECKSDMQINLELGKRLNPQAWPWQNVREMFCSMIRPTGMTFEELRRRGFVYDAFEYKKHETQPL